MPSMNSIEYRLTVLPLGNATNVSLAWTQLGIDNVTNATQFAVRDLWAKKTIFEAKASGFVTEVPSHDLAVYRLSETSR